MLTHVTANIDDAVGVALGDALSRFQGDGSSADAHCVLHTPALNNYAIRRTMNGDGAILGVNITLHLNIGHGSIGACADSLVLKVAIVDAVAIIKTLNIDGAGSATGRSHIHGHEIGLSIFIEGVNLFIIFLNISTGNFGAVINQLATGFFHSYGINLCQQIGVVGNIDGRRALGLQSAAGASALEIIGFHSDIATGGHQFGNFHIVH